MRHIALARVNRSADLSAYRLVKKSAADRGKCRDTTSIGCLQLLNYTETRWYLTQMVARAKPPPDHERGSCAAAALGQLR
jgi:hypothetical protein